MNHFFSLSFQEEKRGEKEEEEIAPFAFRKKTTALLKEASSQRGKRRGHDDTYTVQQDATLPEGRLFI